MNPYIGASKNLLYFSLFSPLRDKRKMPDPLRHLPLQRLYEVSLPLSTMTDYFPSRSSTAQTAAAFPPTLPSCTTSLS